MRALGEIMLSSMSSIGSWLRSILWNEEKLGLPFTFGFASELSWVVLSVVLTRNPCNTELWLILLSLVEVKIFTFGAFAQ